MSVRLESEVARQAGKAALAARDGGVELLGRGEVDVPGEPPGRRVVDRRPGGRTCRRRAAPPIQWLTRPGVVEALDFGFGDGRHRRFLIVRWRRRHDTPSPAVRTRRAGPEVRTAAASPDRASRGRPRPVARWAAARARASMRDDRRTISSERRARRRRCPTASQPAGRQRPRRPAGSRQVVRDRRADERPAGERDRAAGGRRAGANPPTARRRRAATAATTSVADPFVRLRWMRRQGRRERAPRPGPEEGGRPRSVERQALSGSAQDHRELARRRCTTSSGRREEVRPAADGRPEQAGRRRRAVRTPPTTPRPRSSPRHARVDERRPGRPRRRPGGRGRSRADRR